MKNNNYLLLGLALIIASIFSLIKGWNDLKKEMTSTKSHADVFAKLFYIFITNKTGYAVIGLIMLFIGVSFVMLYLGYM